MKTPRYFKVKKWLLIVVIALLTMFTGLLVIGYFLTFFGVVKIKDRTHPEGMGADEQHESHKQKIRDIFGFIETVFLFITYLFGLIGIIRQNFCFTAIFVVAQLASTIISGFITIFNGFWIELLTTEIPGFVIILLALFFLKDLNEIRQQRKVVEENNYNTPCNLETSSNF